MMRYRLIILFFLATIFLRETAVMADGLSLDGTLTTGLEIGLGAPNVLASSTVVLQLKLSQPLADYGAVAAKLEIGAGIDDVPHLREAFWDLYLEAWDLRLGKQRLAWGATDWVNPTDNFNPVDYTRPFEEDNRLEVLAVKADRYFEHWQCEIAWMPVFLPAKQPLPGSRWSPPFTPPALPPGITDLTLAPAVLPARTLANSEYGLRLSGKILGADVALSYFDGWDDLPSLHASISPPVMTLTPRYHRTRVVGADFAAVHGAFGFRGEAAFFATEDRDKVDPEIKNPYGQLVLGVDYTKADRLYLQVQAVLESVQASVGLPEPDEGHSWGLTVAAKYNPNANLELSLGGMYNITEADFLIRPTIAYTPADGVKLSVGAVVLGGPDGTRFGQFDANDYGFVQFAVMFSKRDVIKSVEYLSQRHKSIGNHS